MTGYCRVWRALGRFLVCAGLVVACGPSAFDGLTGGNGPATDGGTGPVVDPDLVAPRPIAPISVSWIASPRPLLKWQLRGASTGAIVELCRTRSCEKIEHSYDVMGSEFEPPEDLASGPWFWRIRARSATKVGTALSPTWEFFVRGPASSGPQPAPQGAIVDVNGDGEPDLLAGGRLGEATEVYVYLGMPGGVLPERPSYVVGDLGATGQAGLPIGGGTDVDGDGFADAIIGVQLVEDGGSFPYAGALLGSPTRLSFAPIAAILDGYAQVGRSVREAGDVNGDGYGDVIVGARSEAFVVFGEKALPASRQFVPLTFADLSKDAAGQTVLGAVDFNGDGLSDVITSLSDRAIGALAVLSGPDGPLLRYGPLTSGTGIVAQATTLASGDFDGDGTPDVWVGAATSSQSYVCTHRGRTDRIPELVNCVAAAAETATVGIAATAVDLDEDGKDELIVVSKRPTTLELELVRDALGAATIQPLGRIGIGSAITTVWPGRPGKPRWAAVAADKDEILVFEGTDLKQILRPPVDRPVGALVRSLR